MQISGGLQELKFLTRLREFCGYQNIRLTAECTIEAVHVSDKMNPQHINYKSIHFSLDRLCTFLYLEIEIQNK